MTSKDLYVRYVDGAEQSVTPLGAENGTRVVDAGTILIVVRSMALAKGVMIGLTRQRVAFNQDIKALIPNDIVHPDFLLFSLWGHEAVLRRLIDEASHGTKRIQTGRLLGFEIPLPSLDEQRAIVSVIAALDGKIESNRRVASAARDVLRLVTPPSGDRVPLTEVATFLNGGALTKLATGDGRPILRIKELRAGVTADTPRTDAEVRSDHEVRFGDLLFSWSGTLLVDRWSGEDAVLNQHIFRVIPKPGFPLWVVEGWLEQHLPSFRQIAADKATTMGHIQRHHLAEAEVTVPDALSELEEWSSLDRLRMGALSEASKLLRVRDALLPGLVSGRLRLRDVSAETLSTA